MNGVLFSQTLLGPGQNLAAWEKSEYAVAPDAGAAQSYRVHDDPAQRALVRDVPRAVPFDLQKFPAQGTRYALAPVSDTGPVAEPHAFLLVVAFCVPPAFHDDMEAWYNDEHIGLLMKADGWLRARRFHVAGPYAGPQWTSVALHELRNLAVLDSEARRIARSTPWRARLAVEPWFENNGRWVYERV